VRPYYFEFISHVTSDLLVLFPLLYYLGFRQISVVRLSPSVVVVLDYLVKFRSFPEISA
jgi:hypothetical protein